MNQVSYQRIPRSKCVFVIDLVKAAYEAGIMEGRKVTMGEATDALVSAYHGDEMLFDGCGDGLAEPYSEKYAPEKGEKLHDRLRGAVNDLYSIKWWEPDSMYRDSDSLYRAENLMLLETEFKPLWGRLCDSLFGDDHPNFWESIELVEQKQRKAKQSSKADTVALQATVFSNEKPSINSATHDRLQRAISAFPLRYPEYTTRLPKLDTDLRPWLKEAGLANNTREESVFGAILSEHFNLSPDTQKPQQ